ncbi:MAG: membrane protein insertase YidC [Arachidicoccus sp.]|nr:membrane protein insertase YidC [Arachidicoccus sp.]
MKGDKNTIIGSILLAILIIAYFLLNNKDRKAYEAQQKRIQDSIALVQKAQIKPISTADSLHADSLSKLSAAGGFTVAAIGNEQTQIVENDLMKIYFSNKGGRIEKVELKKYKSYDSSLVALGGKESQLGFAVNTSPTNSVYTNDLYFSELPVVKNADGSQTVIYEIKEANGQSVQNTYTIPKSDYLIDWNINVNGAPQLITGNTLNIRWNTVTERRQYAIKYEKQQSFLCYDTPEDGYDYNNALKGVSKDFSKGANWIGFKQQFFNQTLLAKNKFKSGSAAMAATSSDADDTSKIIFNDSANLQLQIPATASVSVPMQLYFGPNDYHVLKKYDNGMKNMIDLGSGILAFVKYINLWIIMPVFTFIASFVSNYGWVIILLTIFIRVVTSPLTYKSYYSSAKMKVLKPELDQLKQKFPDQQTFALEQMKLFREAGVNPLSGCFPILLQIPIFFALYRFFNSNIALRGQGFLWAHDLSSYDSIIHFGTHIPLLGDHLSLFTITYCITSLFTSMYNMNMSTQSNAPGQEMMKYMPYIMPFVMFFAFNGLPAALTLYYTISNLVTLGIQLVIQKYILDHNKILAQINEKRKQPKQKSKFQVRMEQMQEQQKKMQELRKKN